MPSPTTEISQSVAPSAVRTQNTVAKLLRDRIASGHYQVGEWLPTERILAEDLNVARRVVRTAVTQLVREGIIERRPNCRPIIRGAEQRQSQDLEPTSVSPISSSNFVALMMWHGGGALEQESNSSQQLIFWGINQTLAEMGYHTAFLDLGRVGTEEENANREAAHLQYIMERGFAGAIFYPYAYRSNHALVQQALQSMPLVMIDRRIAHTETDFVGTANYQSMYDIVMHLVEQGHRRIAYATKCELIQSVEDRLQGYMDAVRDAKIDEVVLTIPPNVLESDWTVVDAVFKLPHELQPTAVAVFNDYAAGGLVDRLQQLGLSVPDDVAVTGFDNIIQTLPGGLELTTVAQPYVEIGKNAAQLLLRRLKDPSALPMSVEIPGKLIVRESSSPKISS